TRDGGGHGWIRAQVPERVTERISRVRDQPSLPIEQVHVLVRRERREPLGGAGEIYRGAYDGDGLTVGGKDRDHDNGRGRIAAKRALERLRYEGRPLPRHADEVVALREIPSDQRLIRRVEREQRTTRVLNEDRQGLALD